jgi:monoterpene epsilon-lactone hydrolase
VRLFALASVIICFVSLSIATGQEQIENAPDIPVPAAASEELQAAIRGRSWPDIADLPEPPTNSAAWLALIEKADTTRSSNIPSVLEQANVALHRAEIAGVKVHHLTPTIVSPEHKDRLFLYLHGGAYVYGNGDAGISEAILIAKRIGIPVISVDYRMPPREPFPAAVDDATAVYQALLKSRSATSIIIGGTSAGGGLALAAVHQFRNLDIPFPGAIYAGTPWADLTKTGDTLYSNERLDRVLLTYDGGLGAAARLYAGDHDIRDPLISPVYGDFRLFPPTILTTGTRDMFLSDVARTHRKLRESGVVAELHVYEGLSHAGYLVSPDTPESLSMYRELDAFLNRFLD